VRRDAPKKTDARQFGKGASRRTLPDCKGFAEMKAKECRRENRAGPWRRSSDCRLSCWRNQVAGLPATWSTLRRHLCNNDNRLIGPPPMSRKLRWSG